MCSKRQEELLNAILDAILDLARAVLFRTLPHVAVFIADLLLRILEVPGSILSQEAK
jgi:hypothetical protein